MSFRYKKKFPIEPRRKLVNNKNNLEYTKGDILNLGNKTTNVVKKEGVKSLGYKLESDIFNQKKNNAPRTRINPTNQSNVFNSMKNENQFSKEIKDYTKQNRIPKKEYDPTPYYNKLTATEQKLQFNFGDHQFL